MDEEKNYNEPDDYESTEDVARKKIVYVDDVYYSLVTIKERLSDKYDVYPAQSAGKMFEILNSTKPDLIMLDLYMPDVNGFELIKQIKSDKRYAEIPVVFLSSKNDKNSVIEGMKLGASDFINKPVSTEKLIEFIEYNTDEAKRAAVKPIILAIDDAPSILQAINSLLSKHYTIFTLPEVKTPQILTELLKKVTPDLFLLDYKMPVLTGFDLVPIIREVSGHDETPIIFLTSEKTVDAVTVATNLGACDYIVKPIDEDILRKKITKHLADFITKRRIRSLNDEMKR
jgi:PleD family two-component response regulator